MNEETPETDSAPGPGANDPAPSQGIPRLPKPPGTSSAAARKADPVGPETDKGRARQVSAPSKVAAPKPPGSSRPAAKAPAAGKTPAAAGKTPPGRNLAAKNPAAKNPATKTSAAGKTQPAKTAPAGNPAGDASSTREGRAEGVKKPATRTLTAADYARTTGQSAATTAVIPAVRDDRPPAPKPAPAVESTPPGDSASSTRRASLRLVHIEPWSVTRLAFAISVALMIVGVVAVAIFWVVLEFTGVWNQINESVTSVLSDDSTSFNITDYLGFSRLVGLTLVLSAINVVLFTALATIGAHLYNLAAQLLGGVEVTFAEEK